MAPVVTRREGEGYFEAANRAQREAIGNLFSFKKTAPAEVAGSISGPAIGYFEAANKAQREAVAALFGFAPPLPPPVFYSQPPPLPPADGSPLPAPPAGGKESVGSFFGVKPDAFAVARPPDGAPQQYGGGGQSEGSLALQASLGQARSDRQSIVDVNYFEVRSPLGPHTLLGAHSRPMPPCGPCLLGVGHHGTRLP